MSCFNSLRFDLAIPDEQSMPYYTENRIVLLRTGQASLDSAN